MKEIEGYSISKQLQGNSFFDIFLGTELSTDSEVLIKTFSTSDTEAMQEDWFSRLLIKEHETARVLSKKSIAPTSKFKETDTSEFLVYQTNNYKLLSDYIQRKTTDYMLVYKLAIEISRQLELSHERGYAHFNINPQSILFDLASSQVKLVNFCTIGRYDLFCNLAYIAPEQTGKLALKADFRADFYSLGLILYQMLTGFHPIRETDSKTINRRQITDRFVAPIKIDSNIPVALSDIIYKLTAKHARGRYQNATSLRFDLLKGKELLEQKFLQRSFGLGSLDYISNVEFPKANAFFEREKDDIIETIRHVKSDEISVFSIPGSMSQGKDDFMRDLISRLDERKLFNVFVTALPVNKDEPFHTASQLLKETAHYMRNSNVFEQRDIAMFFHSLPNQLAQVLLKLCPHFTSLFGLKIDQKCENIDDNSVVCAAVRQFINFVTSRTRPLIIYIENVENIDSSSLKLFIELQTERKLQSFVLIHSTREPIVSTKAIKTDKVSFHQYDIPELNHKKLLTLVNNIFKLEGEDAELLVSLVELKTKGKIRQVNAFLTQMIERKFVAFDRNEFRWKIHEANIKSYNYEQGYEFIVAAKYSQLNEQYQNLLVQCACIGYMFDICLLQKIHGYNIRSLSATFREIKTLGLVEPIEKFSSLNNANNPVLYKFKNTKIYEFFLKLIGEEEKKLLENLYSAIIDSCSTDSNYLSHFDEFVKRNQTLLSELSSDEVLEIIQFYYKKADAFHYLNKRREAERYITYCISLVKTESWLFKYYLTRDIHLLAVKIFSNLYNFAKSDAIYEQAMRHITDHEDVFALGQTQVDSLLLRGKADEAGLLMASLLQLAGFKLPSFNALEAFRHFVVEKVMVNKLYNNELTNDNGRVSFSQRVLTFVNIRSKGVNLSLYQYSLHKIRLDIVRGGLHPVHFMPLLVHSKELIGSGKTFELGIKISSTIINLMVPQASNFEEELHFFFLHFIPYTGYLSQLHSNELIDKYIHQGCNTKATQVAQSMYSLEFFKGKNLEHLACEIEFTLGNLDGFSGKTRLIYVLKVIDARIRALMQARGKINLMAPVAPGHREKLDQSIASCWNNTTLIVYFYLTGEYDKVMIGINNISINLQSAQCSLPMQVSQFYECLVACSRESKPEIHPGSIKKTVAYFKRLAQFSPKNFQAPYLILRAEQYRVEAKYQKAAKYYNEAIAACEIQEMYHLNGLAHYRLSMLHKYTGNVQKHARHVIKAHNIFKCWGADLIADKIKLEHLSLFNDLESRIYNLS